MWTKAYRLPRNQRLDAKLYCNSALVYFITIRAFANSAPFGNNKLSRCIIEVLREEQELSDCKVFTYCLMPDHLHYLLSPKADGTCVLHFTERFKGRSTNASWRQGWKGKLWQPRFYDHIVRTKESRNTIAQYILDNPVRRALVNDGCEWPLAGNMNELSM